MSAKQELDSWMRRVQRIHMADDPRLTDLNDRMISYLQNRVDNLEAQVERLRLSNRELRRELKDGG